MKTRARISRKQTGESIPSFKPNLLRSTKAMAERACHGFGSTTQVGLTQALDALLCAQISASNKTVFFLKSNLKFLRGTPWRNILKNWLFLATAIIFEVIATSALKSSEGFTRLVPSFIVVAGYAAAFYFLSLTLKSIPVGIAYAVWSGLGIVLVTAIAWVLHGQKLDMWGFVGVGFIISGVAVLNLLSKASVH